MTTATSSNPTPPRQTVVPTAPSSIGVFDSDCVVEGDRLARVGAGGRVGRGKAVLVGDGAVVGVSVGGGGGSVLVAVGVSTGETGSST